MDGSQAVLIWGCLPSGSVVKNPPAMQETQVGMGSIPGSGRSPGERDGNPLSIVWKIPWTEEPSRLHTVLGVAKSHTTEHSIHIRQPISNY